jgi:hypothetical protein
VLCFIRPVVSVTGRSLVQRSATECGVSESDIETSKLRRPKSTGAVESKEGKIHDIKHLLLYSFI